MTRRLLLAALLACTGTASAAVGLSTLDGGMPSPPTRVMVLGSVHLAQGGAGGPFDPAVLEGLLQRLQAYGPQIITVEAMPGETCDLMRRLPHQYDRETTDAYCPDTSKARAATSLDVPAALAAVEERLAAWPAAPSAAQRRALASLFMAAGDPVSALVQWLHLPAGERVAGDGLDEALVARLRKLEASPNENTRIAAVLAVRLGLQRVYPVDDHAGDALRIDDGEAFGKAIRAAWSSGGEACDRLHERQDALRAQPDLLPLYRLVNDDAWLAAAARCDFGAALAEPSAKRYGRQYVAGWDLRNLRMVANIGTTFREGPGARMLSIVGASHKPWFDRLLGQLQGVELVDARSVLGD